MLWDVLTISVSSPEVYSGKRVLVEVLLEDNAQRGKYSKGSFITFSAAPLGMEQSKVMLHVSDIHGA
jgi:hypothetical protein